MTQSYVMKMRAVRIISLFALLSLSACTAAITHIPSGDLQDLKLQQPPRIVVADIGDARQGEEPNVIGEGFSEWLPIIYYATDPDGKDLPVSFYIARSLGEDLHQLGYIVLFVNDNNERKPLKPEDALDSAAKQEADYLVTTRVTDGKTNYWGFLLIPFYEPVWTRIGYDVQIYNVKTGSVGAPEHTFHKDTEWYFGKITITDSVIDAGLFGGRWLQSAWGSTIVSNTLAESAKKISAEIQAQGANKAGSP